MNTEEAWPAGQTWCFQGTVLEDATGGTHVSTLTVTPGAGNEMLIIGGQVQVGNTATSQLCTVFVDDGANVLFYLFNAEANAATTASLNYPFPQVTTSSPLASTSDVQATGFPNCFLSGTMRLIMRVSTAAVSVTQTFSLVCRIRGTLPTATLADSVGTPTLTTNTNRTF